MRNILLTILSCVSMMLFFSCSETDDSSTEYNDWQSKNDAFFEQQYQRALDSIAVNPTKWKLIKNISKDPAVEGAHTDYVIVHVLSQSADHDETATPAYAESPLYTDSVRVHLRGNLIPSPSYNVVSPSYVAKGYQFDTSWDGDYDATNLVPVSYNVSGLIDGFATALQKMHVGDRWEVCIPYQMAYGTTDRTSIPGYSVLIFDVTLHSFVHSGQSFPKFQ